MKRTPSSIARQLLKENDYTSHPINLISIANIANVKIVEAELPADVSGMLYREKGETTIYVRVSDPPLRKRFTIAHELGHYFLNHWQGTHIDKGVNTQVTTLLRNTRSSKAIDPNEIDANQFAAELLMPEAMVKEFFKKNIHHLKSAGEEFFLDLMATAFKVSQVAMSIRLQNLGLINMKTLG